MFVHYSSLSCCVVGSDDMLLAMHELHYEMASGFWHDIFLWPPGFFHREAYRLFFLYRSGHILVLQSRQRS